MNNSLNESVSIIIPTLCEARNIPELLKRIAQLNWGVRSFEVIVVDDNSQDGIVEAVDALSLLYPWLRLIVRYGKKGLSQAVIDGFDVAKYPILIVMDADLSHPPEKIPEMLAMIENNDVDMVIGSRYIQNGSSDTTWPIARKRVSVFAAWIARMLVAVSVKDPLSGFIALRKKTYLSATVLKPIGWKVALELMVKCKCKNIKEIPIHFSKRVHGHSKLTSKVILDYLAHIWRLAWYKFFLERK